MPASTGWPTQTTFTCTRCEASQRPDQFTWLGSAEPQWHYRLDETLFQFLRNRGDLPALTVFERFSRSPHAVLAEAELNAVDRSGAKSELAFAVVEGGDLWLGEAFTADRYAPERRRERKRLERLRAPPELLDARGVILATAAETLSDRTREQARQVIAGPWPQLEVRERAWTLRRPAQLIDAAP